MSTIGIDFGTKRVGIAVQVENLAIPLKIVERHKISDELKKIVKERQVKTIVLGDPLNMDGSLSQTSLKIREFQKTLSSLFPGIKIVLVDERLSSFEASLVSDKYGEKDDIAASIILNSYLSNLSS